MRFLVLADIHGDIESLEKLDEEFAQSDAVLFAGDFARFGNPETGLPVLNTLVKKHDTLFSVIGNCDAPSFLEELEKLDVSVQGDIIFRDGLVFAGSGGALRFSGKTLNERSDDELADDLKIITEQSSLYLDEAVAEQGSKEWRNLVLIVHQPPYDTRTDIISSGIHVGSRKIREFIEKTQPLAVITGHIHESASICKIGKSVIINPGSLAEKKYAVMEVSRKDNNWEIDSAELCTFE
jgi:hypothetical protein